MVLPGSRDSIGYAVGLFALGLAIAGLAAWDARVLVGVSCVFVFLLAPAAKPELAMAILFNGTLLFFYSLYKLGYEPNQAVTGGFYALLLVSYTLPSMLLLTRGRKFRFAPGDVLFLLFFTGLFISYFACGTANPSATTKIGYAPFMVIGPYFAVRFLASGTRLRKFFDSCILIGMVLAGAAFYELFASGISSGGMRFSICTFSEHGVNPILFGTTFAVLGLIVLVRAFDGRTGRGKYLLVAVVCAWLVLRAGSRGAMLSMCVSGVGYVVFLARMRWSVKIVILLGVVAAVSIGMLSLPKSTRGFYQYSVTAGASADEASSIHTRLYFWGEAMRDFQSSPFVGVGTGNSVGGQGYPHNIVLEILAEQGLVGFAVFTGLCLCAVMQALLFIRRQQSPELIVLGKQALVLFVYAMTEAFFSNYITRQTQLFMALALLVSLGRAVADRRQAEVGLPAAAQRQSPAEASCCPL